MPNPTRRGRARRAALAILLTGLAAAAPVTQPDQAKAPAQPVPPTDGLSFIPASETTWSVSDTEAGCYLLSPRQREGSGLAIGRRPDRTFGLFLVGFGLAMTLNKGEPVLIQAGGATISGSARMIGSKLLFVPLGTADMASVLQELRDNGMVWLKVRRTWITHSGDGLPAALQTYGATCAASAAASR